MELFKLLGTIAINNTDANNAIEETTGKAEKSESKMSKAFQKIGVAVVAAFSVKKISDFGNACLEAAASVKAANSQFEQTFGKLSNEATKAIRKVSEESGIMETRLKGVGTSIYAFAKSSGARSSEAMKLMQTALKATADAAAYYDRSLEDTAASLQSFLKGNFENDAALGVSCTETTRNAAAMELFGKKYEKLTEIQKQQTLLKMVTDAQELSGAMGQASREADGWENVIGNLKEAWKQFMAVVGAPILSAMVPIIQKLTTGIEKLGNGLKKTQEFFQKHQVLAGILVGLFGMLTISILAYKISLGAAAIAQGLLTTATVIATAATATFGTVLSAITSPIGLVVLAITGLIAIGVALYKNWDSIKAKAAELKQAVVSKWNEIKTGIANSNLAQAASKAMDAMKKTVSDKLKNIEDAYKNHGGGVKGIIAGSMQYVKEAYTLGLSFIDNLTGGKLTEIKNKFFGKFTEIKNIIQQKLNEAKIAVKNAIEKIKGFFKFEWSLPKIKLPHFKITGKFSLSPPSIPKISVDWYKKAMNEPMIMNSPTAFGINRFGQIMAGGEAGSEVVSGTNTLMNMISSAVAAQNQKTEQTLLNILELLVQYMPQLGNMQMVLDSGAMVGQLAPSMDAALGKLATRSGRGVK